MSRDREEEKRFSEYLDRIIAGEEIRLDEEISLELVSTLKFAQKMTSLRPSPSPQFAAALQVKLMDKLARRETAKKSFWELISGALKQPVWQTAAIVLFVFILGGTLWAIGLFGPWESTAPKPTYTATTTATTATTTTTAAATGYITADASTDKGAYLPGEEVNITVSLTNTTAQPMTIEHYPPILSLMNSESRQTVYTFRAGTGAVTLEPDETVEFDLTWDQTDYRGDSAAAGNYYLELEEIDYMDSSIKLDFSNPVSFDILPYN